jgi:hypothetical protein
MPTGSGNVLGALDAERVGETAACGRRSRYAEVAEQAGVADQRIPSIALRTRGAGGSAALLARLTAMPSPHA